VSEPVFVTVFKQDFQTFERIPVEAAQELMAVGVIKPAWKPNRKGKLKPVLVSLDVLSKIRDRSCSMGPRITEGNAMDRQDCVALVKEWGRNRLIALSA
jgi:hypothetical protein